MRLYPEMTAALWSHDLEPVYSGDTIDLDTTDVTFALADLDGTIIQEPLAATKIGTSFRLIITVPAEDPRWGHVTDIAALPDHLTDEIDHFFDVYQMLEPDKHTNTKGYEGVAAAWTEIQAAFDRYVPHPEGH